MGLETDPYQSIAHTGASTVARGLGARRGRGCAGRLATRGTARTRGGGGGPSASTMRPTGLSGGRR